MKLIGMEEHFLTAEVRHAWDAIGLNAVDPSVAFHSGVIERRLLDLAEERLALMDETGLDVQVVSLTTPALHDLGPDSVDMARRTNDALAEAVARHPTRFQALATLPVTMPEEAALELERCVRTLGFKGTMLCGRVGTRNLDDPVFALIFRRLVLAGTFDRMPGLQVILGHWGELVLFYAERLAAMDRVAGLAQPIATYLRRNLHVTASGMFLPHYMERAIAVVGTDRLLFSTDFPYQYRPGRDARRFLETCGLDEASTADLAHGNWTRLTEGCTGGEREPGAQMGG
jgi:predicted TIM-barrel fold metal-dependent hydrolase